MTALVYTMGVVLFALGVIASIALHEVGHMYPAKKFGVKVTQYFVGFGKTVWSVKRGDTEYGVKAIPMGGFIRMVGMLPPAKRGPDGRVLGFSGGFFGKLIADARAVEYEHVTEEDQDRLFYRKAWWKKVIIMSGGPMMNVFLAVILLSTVFMGFGVKEPTLTVDQVSDCVIPASQPRPGRRTARTPTRSPRHARQASTWATRSLSVNGTAGLRLGPVHRRCSAPTAPAPVDVVVERDGVDAHACTTHTTVSERLDLANPDQYRPGRLPRRARRPQIQRPTGTGYVASHDGRLHQEDRRGARPHAAADGRRGQGRLRAGGPRPERPDERRRRQPGRRRGRLRATRSDRRRPVRDPAHAARRRQPVRGALQLHPAAAARRRAHRRRASTRRCAAGSRGCAASPTPATPTWPSCCRSRTPRRPCSS